MRRFFFWGLLAGMLALNEWAFRFIFDMQPVDQFMRLMVLVLDALLLPLMFAFRTDVFELHGAKHLLRQWPKASAIWIGCFVSYCLLMSVEFTLRYYFKNIYAPPYSEVKTWKPALHLPDPELGHHLPKSTVVTHTLTVNDTLVYQVEYATDKQRRRVASQRDSSRSGSPIIIDGCSFAFGWGLSDDQTLDGFLAQHFPARPVYNLATSGYGTQQVFMHCRDPYYTEGISDSATYLYLFIDEHVRRLNGSRRLMGLWAENFPFLASDGSEVQYLGSFRNARFWQTVLWKSLGKSAIFWATDLDLPWYDSDRMVGLAASTLARSKAEFRSHHPNSDFIVVIAPRSDLSQRLIPELNKLGVEFLDLTELLNPAEREYQIHWTEAHPNGQYYQQMARAIFNYESR